MYLLFPRQPLLVMSSPLPVHRPLRAVLDTNVVLDIFYFADRRTQPLERAIDAGRLRCFTNTDCLDELERVLAYPDFALTPVAQKRLIATYLGRSTVDSEEMTYNIELPRCRDADDQKFLILAAHCQANLLITRDKDLLRLARHRSRRLPFTIQTAEDAALKFLQD